MSATLVLCGSCVGSVVTLPSQFPVVSLSLSDCVILGREEGGY